MSDYGRFDDGVEEWREEMAKSPDWHEQRKANYVPPRVKYERALDFIERERSSVYEMLRRRCIACIRDREIFDIDYEAKDLKRDLVDRLGYTAKEVKAMFKGFYGAVVNRELILEIPELAGYTKIRMCGISDFYRGTAIEDIEKSHARDMESGGDFAA